MGQCNLRQSIYKAILRLEILTSDTNSPSDLKLHIYCCVSFLLLLSTLSVVSDSFVTPWTAPHQAPLSVRFSGQDYGSELPFPPPGDLPTPGIEPRSPALQADYILSHQGSEPSSPEQIENISANAGRSLLQNRSKICGPTFQTARRACEVNVETDFSFPSI